MTASRQVCFVVGARPNFMKVAPVHRALTELDTELELSVVHTGQHYDSEMSDVFIDELELPQPDVFLGIGSGTHAEQTAKALVGVERFLLERAPALVVVAGDVNSTLAGAVAAARTGTAVCHIESGLRSNDWLMPEESNRVITDHLSALLLTHSEDANVNLLGEGIAEDRIVFVGNTMIDTLVRMRPRVAQSRVLAELGLERGGYVLVTLHRPALVDGPLLADAVARLDRHIAGAKRSDPTIGAAHLNHIAWLDRLVQQQNDPAEQVRDSPL